MISAELHGNEREYLYSLYTTATISGDAVGRGCRTHVVNHRGILCTVGYNIARTTIRRQIHERLQLAAANRREMIQIYVEQQQERAALIASRTRLRGLIKQRIAGEIDQDAMQAAAIPILRDALGTIPQLKAIGIFGKDGSLLTTTNETWFTRRLKKRSRFHLCTNWAHSHRTPLSK